MKIKQWLGLSLLTLTLFTGCGGDNAHDGKTGLTGSAGGIGTSDTLSSLQKNIFQANANAFVDELNSLERILKGYDENLTNSNVEKLQSSFVSIIQTWKAVEVTYVAGDYDETLIDTPRFIDYFIKASKNQSIPNDVQDALDSTTAIETALFKNTSKSIQALEYLIYGKQESTDSLVTQMNKDKYRRVDALKVVVENLKSRGSIIADFYKNDTKFIADTTDALNALVNALRQSTFDLKEKRIGEPAGFIIKTKDSPDATKLEYYNSKNTMIAIKAILQAHQSVISGSSYANLGSFASANGATDSINNIKLNLSNAVVISNQIDLLEDELKSEEMDSNIKKLYDEITKLQTNYETSLVNSLDLTVNIIDADGD